MLPQLTVHWDPFDILPEKGDVPTNVRSQPGPQMRPPNNIQRETYVCRVISRPTPHHIRHLAQSADATSPQARERRQDLLESIQHSSP